MAEECVAVCETDNCNWQSDPTDRHITAVNELADHRIQTGTHDGRVYDAAEVSA